jgi:PTH2 family peptidyl-tRNA hydrolase
MYQMNQLERMKMVIVIRRDLQMGPGKEIAQGAHAAMGAADNTIAKKWSGFVHSWRDSGQAKIVVYVDSREDLLALMMKADASGIGNYLVRDAGRTEVDFGTPTALGIGPDFESVIDEITDHLKLYRASSMNPFSRGVASEHEARPMEPTMTVKLEDCGRKKIAVIKELRAGYGLSLKDAKHLSDKAPLILPPIQPGKGAAMVRALREAGATVTVVDPSAIDKITAATYIQSAGEALGDGNLDETRASLRAALTLLGDV